FFHRYDQVVSTILAGTLGLFRVCLTDCIYSVERLRSTDRQGCLRQTQLPSALTVNAGALVGSLIRDIFYLLSTHHVLQNLIWDRLDESLDRHSNPEACPLLRAALPRSCPRRARNATYYS